VIKSRQLSSVITGLVRPRDGSGARVLARIDGAGSSHQIVDYLHARAMSYSVGFTLPHHTPKLPELIPDSAWTPAYDAHNEVRDRAWVAELTDLLDLTATGWPPGMRVIVRKERPHPGAQLRITDVDGHRITAFATNTLTGGPGTELPELELRHRRRARAPRPNPRRQRQRPGQPPHARPESEPDLVRDRGPGLRDHQLDATTRATRAPRTTVGTQTTPAAPVLHRVGLEYRILCLTCRFVVSGSVMRRGDTRW
jgi:DDE family transposase